MRICPKCLSVYGSSFIRYCQFDGEKTFAQEKQKLIEEIEELRKQKVDFGKNPDMNMPYNQMLVGFDQALQEVIERIKNK